MAKYTVVNEGYDVEIYPSFKNLLQEYWPEFKDCYLEQDNQCAITQAGLLRALELDGCARVFDPDALAWRYKIQKHNY
jgi:hypothetical protein